MLFLVIPFALFHPVLTSRYLALSSLALQPNCAAFPFPFHPPLSPYFSSPHEQDFNVLHYLGNLSPWRTVNHGLNSTAQVPEGCEVEQVRFFFFLRLFCLFCHSPSPALSASSATVARRCLSQVVDTTASLSAMRGRCH